jgi:hypothetical protein
MAARWLRWLLRAGAVYFICVSAVHWAGMKVPGLFIYYSIPSYAYQDRGIGTLAIGWAALLFAASRQFAILTPVLAAGAAGLLGFSMINLSAEMRTLASPHDLAMFWGEIMALAAYVSVITVLTVVVKRQRSV